MRQYVINELRTSEIEAIRHYLDGHAEKGPIDNFYWLAMPDDLLSPDQYEHRECRPHSAGIELGGDFLKFELLIRSRGRIRCKCVSFATNQQRNFILSFADKLLDECNIHV